MLDPHPFLDRPDAERMKALAWVNFKLDPKASWNYRHTSEDMVVLLNRDTGLNLSEDEFKYAMMESHYKPANAKREHWVYRVSERSYAFAKGDCRNG